MLGKTEGKKSSEGQRMDMNLSKLREIVKDSLACCCPWGLRLCPWGLRLLHDLATEQQQQFFRINYICNILSLSSTYLSMFLMTLVNYTVFNSEVQFIKVILHGIIFLLLLYIRNLCLTQDHNNSLPFFFLEVL